MASIPTTLDTSRFTTVWSTSFDNGLGPVGHSWGNVSVQNGEARLTALASQDYQVNSGFMQRPSGPADNQGYGLYSATLSLDPFEGPGAYVVLWPSSDTWPGPEIDLVEKFGSDSNTNGYSTVHWRGAGGWDEYESFPLTGIDLSKVHTYALDWAADHLALYVDGRLIWSTTAHVPQDHAHGGENLAFGAGMQASWAADRQNGNNVLHIYDMSYAAPAGGGASAAPSPASPASSSPSGGNDRLTGTTAANAINALAGHDSVNGGGGNDSISGGPGMDSVTGGAGADVFAFAYGDGGAAPSHDVITDFVVGTDRLQFPGGAVLHTEDEPAGQWVHYGSNRGNNDWVQLLGVHDATLAQLTGSAGSPTPPTPAPATPAPTTPLPATPAPSPSPAPAARNGTGGADRMSGSTGADSINGLAGADTIAGGAGADTIAGGAGIDSVSGGSGADVFAFAYGDGGAAHVHDIIADFVVGTDKLRLPSGAALHTEDDPAGQWVHYGSNLGNNDWVLLKGVHGAALADLVL